MSVSHFGWAFASLLLVTPAAAQAEMPPELVCTACASGTSSGASCQPGMDYAQMNVVGTSFRYACLSNAKFAQARMKNVDLTGADVSGASFAGADLSAAVLSYTLAVGADFSGATLAGADLSGANLLQARGLTADQLANACGSSGTRLPAGLTVAACDAGATPAAQ